VATQLDGGRDEEVSAVGKFDHQPCLTSPLWDRRQEKTEVRHHRQSRWLDEWGRLKGDRPYELVFGITAA